MSKGHNSLLILQVHDEVLVEVPPEEKDTVGPLLTSTSCAMPPNSTSHSKSTSVGATRGPQRKAECRRGRGEPSLTRPDTEVTEHWFEPLAEHMGAAYDRYAHTKGTVQEVDHVVEVLGLQSGDHVLDVGCGTGRHAHELARRGIGVHGIDISQRFVEIAQSNAPDGATFERGDARMLGFHEEFDAVICLCQGAFGMMTADGEDAAVVAGMAAALRPDGRLALSAFKRVLRCEVPRRR